ncbi:hypothetical protein PQG02_12450 [Nostoc sp. UHCC 0926]|uniref:hypothetical protein n=1 Tax=unclassified Nostoc TaxID=2593658 RepID=UPI00236318EC|nr:hypothetical protein [Nostoc sp. UHCC 0926]WDD35073.1 hypothetical protein PQG02_12450 [Nostoc sp. UHCC 0926]
MPNASCSTQDPSGDARRLANAALTAVPHRREPPRRGLPHRTGSPTVIENDARYNIAV